MSLWSKGWNKVSSAGNALYSAFVGGEATHAQGYSGSPNPSSSSTASGFSLKRTEDVLVDITVFGVDVGNQCSHVAVARGGGFECILDELTGKRSCPTMVSFLQKERHIGDKAEAQAIRNWKNTVRGAKRLLGLSFDSNQAQHEKKFLPFTTRKGEDGEFEISVEVHGREHFFQPQQILAMVLTKLHSMVQNEAERVNSKVTNLSLHAVLSVPVWLTTCQRERMVDAAKISRVHCIGLINETTAAALEWGVFRSGQVLAHGASVVVAFVDCGESATTISLVAYCGRQLKVLGHVWDTCLGGRDFDWVLFEYFAEEIKKKYHFDVRSDARSCLKLLQSCEKLKKVFSANPVTNLECDLGELDVRFTDLQREWFEGLAQPLLRQMQALIAQARAIPLPAKSKFHGVEILGGASRIPCVKAVVGQEFGVVLSTLLNADETVARGCGIMAAQLSPTMKNQVRRWEVIDCQILPIAAHFNTSGSPGDGQDNHDEFDTMQIAFGIHTEIPTKAIMTTFAPNAQSAIAMELRYEVAALPSNLVHHVSPNLIGTWTLMPASERNRGGQSADGSHRLDIELVVDASGLLIVQSAHVKGAAGSCGVVQTGCGINREEALHRAEAMEAELRALDNLVHITAESKNALESYVIRMLRQLQEGLGDYYSPEGAEAFSQALEDTELWLYDEGQNEEHTTYDSRLATLRETGDVLEERKQAHESLQQQLKDLIAWLHTLQKRMLREGLNEPTAVRPNSELGTLLRHHTPSALQLTDAQKLALKQAVDDAVLWTVRAEIDLQRSSKTELPALTISEIDQSRAKVISKLQQSGILELASPRVDPNSPTTTTAGKPTFGSET